MELLLDLPASKVYCLVRAFILNALINKALTKIRLVYGKS